MPSTALTTSNTTDTHHPTTKLWLDLGNTRLKYWLTDAHGQLLDHAAEQHLQAPAELLRGLVYRFERLAPAFIGVSSVLGQAVNTQVSHCLSQLGVPFKFAQVNAAHPLMQSAYDARQLGVDRWLQMLGAVDASARQCIVGCGTALTIDLIDCGRHMGGYIFPSIHLQRSALYSGTRQIGQVSASFDSIACGQNTEQAVQHGILLSVVGAIHEVQRQYTGFALILTGGDAPVVVAQLDPTLAPTPVIAPDLLLQGLRRFFADV